MQNKDEQWDLNGDCRICRRKEYCGEPCTKHKQLRKIAMQHAINEWLDDREKARKKELRKEKIRKIFKRGKDVQN